MCCIARYSLMACRLGSGTFCFSFLPHAYERRGPPADDDDDNNNNNNNSDSDNSDDNDDNDDDDEEEEETMSNSTLEPVVGPPWSPSWVDYWPKVGQGLGGYAVVATFIWQLAVPAEGPGMWSVLWVCVLGRVAVVWVAFVAVVWVVVLVFVVARAVCQGVKFLLLLLLLLLMLAWRRW